MLTLPEGRDRRLDEGDEGCLSFPGAFVPCARPDFASVTGTGLDGQPVTFSGDGLLARCLQHETDHTLGTVFGDRLATKARKKLQKEHDKLADELLPVLAGLAGGLDVRRIVLFMSVSIDGFMAGVDGDLSWHLVDEEVHQHFNDVLGPMSAFLDGRVTWELMSGYWPTADEDPDASPQEVEFARIWRDMPKVVFSRTLETVGWDAQIRREVDPDEVRSWCAEPGGDMAVGGADLAATFLEHDLVDELRLYVHPVLVGRGKRLFDAGIARGLRAGPDTRLRQRSGAPALRAHRPAEPVTRVT